MWAAQELSLLQTELVSNWSLRPQPPPTGSHVVHFENQPLQTHLRAVQYSTVIACAKLLSIHSPEKNNLKRENILTETIDILRCRKICVCGILFER